ncbi:putative alpha-1,6-mannosyltransferase subunit [Talaromyces proteolyticus]|uniref:Mannosyltransferase n=1 Tax=Talaromyces proteolyticus TaxID=1131652 RepID=A0AAD4Q0N9_9EURO|nr:putative alpha-1,6-mannosyltransferase subunit [Talaromyces proteolyticus]KAH8697772.1 putative alpha-1,6-mannosyltransferase subunit [Talaromyces proteolyticus]
MSKALDVVVYSTIPAVILLHLLAAPYTKVEESFHLQATHDILTYGIPSPTLGHDAIAKKFADQYDHFSFPGSVPRSFVGALALATASRPVIWLDSDVNRQLLARAVLGFFNAFALLLYARGLHGAFGRATAYWFLLFQASQFHVAYYASRTLSNMFAFGITTIALRLLLPRPGGTTISKTYQRYKMSLSLITIAGIIFRSELAVFLATTTIFLLLTNRVRIFNDIIPAGIVGLLVGLSTTVVIDSYFWQSFPLWPEFSAFKFNVISGEASAWGTSPWYFYFVDAIPRLLMNPLIWIVGIPVSLWSDATRRASIALLLPSLAFVGIYSVLPHKEWRFIIYIIPPLTAAGAQGAGYIWTRRTKSIIYRALSLVLALSTLASFLISTIIYLPVSSANYPGAHALKKVHLHGHATQPRIVLHMGNLACQTGVTRFLQLDHSTFPQTLWVYDKTENETVKSTPEFWRGIDYALIEDISEIKRPPSSSGDEDTWKPIETIAGFSGFRILRSGDIAEGHIETDIIREIMGERGVILFETLRDEIIRKYLTRGLWVEFRMVPKIWIMKNFRASYKGSEVDGSVV